ncbi:hypothetical protein [Ornatilinea apprima]|uniref:hypothetical protein n=1 Tax=Ornatilinea apprima TaxID=1134406 RepID=UPI00128F82F2|nr:hypothetical protein [Ornatilinea apprima]
MRTTLLSFEKSLRLISRLLVEDESGILYSRTSAFSPAEIQTLNEKIAAAFEVLQKFTSVLEIESRTEDPLKTIQAQLSLSWVGLEDCHAKQVRSYGKLNDATADTIDQGIEQLIQTLLELMQITSGSQLDDPSIPAYFENDDE